MPPKRAPRFHHHNVPRVNFAPSLGWEALAQYQCRDACLHSLGPLQLGELIDDSYGTVIPWVIGWSWKPLLAWTFNWSSSGFPASLGRSLDIKMRLDPDKSMIGITCWITSFAGCFDLLGWFVKFGHQERNKKWTVCKDSATSGDIKATKVRVWKVLAVNKLLVSSTCAPFCPKTQASPAAYARLANLSPNIGYKGMWHNDLQAQHSNILRVQGTHPTTSYNMDLGLRDHANARFFSTGYSFAGRYSGELSVAQLKSTARRFRQDKKCSCRLLCNFC